MAEEVKLVAMFFEGHSGPGGMGYRGRDVGLGREISIEAGTTIMVSEPMAALLDKKTGWKRGTMAPESAVEPDEGITAPESVEPEQPSPRRAGKKRR